MIKYPDKPQDKWTAEEFAAVAAHQQAFMEREAMTAKLFQFEPRPPGPKCCSCKQLATHLVKLVNVDTGMPAGGKWFCDNCDPLP